MKSIDYVAVFTCILLNASCVSSYREADIRRIDDNKSDGAISDRGISYKYKIGGLQKILVYLTPKRKITQSYDSVFTQNELSKLRIKVISLSDTLIVNGLKIKPGEALVVDLRKEFNFGGTEGEVKDYNKYLQTISLISFDVLSGGDNLVDCILIIEDPERITGTSGLNVQGGDGYSL